MTTTQERLVTLRNITAQTQRIIHDGKAVDIAPFQEGFFDASLAAKFLELKTPFVEAVDLAVRSVYSPTVKPRTMWIANLSGNPDDPLELPIQRRVKGTQGTETVMITNDRRNPMRLTREMRGNEIWYTDTSGFMQTRMEASTIYDLPPYMRREFPISVGRWFMQRDSNRATQPGILPSIIESRPESPFEPNLTWEIDPTRAYLKLVDPNVLDTQLGMDEATLKREFGASDIKLEEETKRAKLLLWKRMFFRLADPQFMLPTKEEFEAYYGRTMKEAKEAKRAARIQSTVEVATVGA